MSLDKIKVKVGATNDRFKSDLEEHPVPPKPDEDCESRNEGIYAIFVLRYKDLDEKFTS